MDKIVTVAGGRVRGVWRGDLWTFSGIPYAEAPQGRVLITAQAANATLPPDVPAPLNRDTGSEITRSVGITRAQPPSDA